MILEKAGRAGIPASQVHFESISKSAYAPSAGDFISCTERLNMFNHDCILPFDEGALKFLTGKSSLRKWHLSPLDTFDQFACRKAMPSFHPSDIMKQWDLSLYLEMAFKKVKRSLGSVTWPRKQKNYSINAGADETIAILESIRHEPWHSLDIETGNGQINTFGIAWSAHDAIAIKALPDHWPVAVYKEIWNLIADICESDSKKIMQNGIYERMFCSSYGMHINNFAHDTMCAMKFLWPELEKGLDNVGRIYTNEPYWKDDGKVHTEEGTRKDWANIKDWDAHLLYNCADTAGTYEAAFKQRADMEARDILALYDSYVVKLFDIVYEMSINGLPLNTEKQAALITEYEAKSKAILATMTKEINPRSPKQKLELLEGKGIDLPKKRCKRTGGFRASADELTLKKARLRYPDDVDIKALLEVSSVEKALSSYLRVGHHNGTIRYMLDLFATETGRGNCRKDVWDKGFNAQTMTGYVKSMIEWPETSDRVFVEIDLSQAESRFVAYDAEETTLLGMLERREDIHRFVAAEIYQKPMADIVHEERQLGKKSGHGANYSMGVQTFIDSCLKEMDLVLDARMAKRVLEAYHSLFPGIRRWHKRIQNEVYSTRKLSNPLGLERYFWGRMDDNTYREAYAYRPQSTIPMITNHLIFGLARERTLGNLDFNFHIQVHDSCVLSCNTAEVPKIAAFALDTSKWHPEIILPAGKLIIPTEVAFGRNLKGVKKYE